jgi:hypothetical protein
MDGSFCAFVHSKKKHECNPLKRREDAMTLPLKSPKAFVVFE